MSQLAVKKLTKVYGSKDAEFVALKDVTFSVEEGETIAIIGKSGSGKSTLMHLLALLDKPSKGAVYIEKQDASKLSSTELDKMRNKRYGFVFQQFFLNGNDTVLNNVILPLKIAGIGKKEREKRGLEVLKSVDLENKASTKAMQLSGGQKQRVCIARALINEPKVIFADEPTGNLDSATGEKIIDLLFKLNKDQGITLIIVTHDSDLAAKCSRQIHIKDGQIVGGK